jgi:Mn-dependent DtxR family transcriptional regulator
MKGKGNAKRRSGYSEVLHVSLSPVILETNRLSILLELSRRGGRIESPELLGLLGMSHRAVLAPHKRRLTDAGLVTHKGKVITLTDNGRKALASLGLAIDTALNGVEQTP